MRTTIFIFLFIWAMGLGKPGYGQVDFQVDTSLTAEQLIHKIWLNPQKSDALAFSNIRHKGAITSLGHFVYKGLAGDLPEKGIILSTGDAADAKGPNLNNRSTIHYSPGDSLVETIASGKTHDATTLSFEFNSFTDSIAFAFVFASDEYMEYVNQGVSDVFGFFCRKKGTQKWHNLATLPNSDTPITVDLINAYENSDYYMQNHFYSDVHDRRNNTPPEIVERAWLLSFDGFTRGIATGMPVEPYSTYQFRITLADVGDAKFDSWVLLVGNSFKSTGNIVTPTINQISSFLSIVDSTLTYTQKNDTLNIASKLYFDFDSHQLKETSKPLLENIAKVMRYSSFSLTVIGYADPSGSEQYNMQLSQKRAESVVSYLHKKGIAPNRIQAIGKGEQGTTKDNAQARKVVFQLVPGDN